MEGAPDEWTTYRYMERRAERHSYEGVRYLGIEVDDALEMAEETEV